MIKINKFIGIGRNTKDGEFRTSESEIAIYNNTLAMTNNFKNKEGNYDSEFINYVAYRQTAEFLNKYSKKGTLIEIEGRITTRTYDKRDGKKGYITEISVENASVLEKKKEEAEIPQNSKTEYDTMGSDVKLENEDIDKVFNQQMELPF